LYPTGKLNPDEPSDDVAVHSNSALPGPTVSPPQPGSESDLTTNLTPVPAAAPATNRSAPAAFGRYQVRSTLGAGGFGAVYLGHDTQLSRPVAIKVLHSRPQVQQTESERLLQEARRLAQMSHPGIVAVHDVGLEGGQVYLVSDYLDGPNLGRWLGENRPAWPEAARIAAAMADALAHAHARSIVHRDIKPENIILTPDRGPVLVDFGLGLDEAGTDGSELGVISGTPAYMAPEQVAGAAHRIDGRTDIYSLGVVLYEMLCGRSPFRAGNVAELLRQVRDDEPQPPRQIRREIPSELERACLKALAKRQQDRYTTAADFAEELRRVLLTRADAPTPSSSRRGAREAERRQVTVLLCGCELFQSEVYLGLDAEDQAGVLRAFHQVCEQAVRRLDGTVVQCTEHGLLACFGYPVAYEDAARRAARTGLGIVDDMKALEARLRREHKLELNAWVGIHTGPAVVEATEDTVSLVGEARNVVLRLEEVATPSGVICSEVTHRLIQGQFDCTSLGGRRIKGIAQPVQLFEVQGVGVACSPIEAAEPAGLSPLTGRDHEVSLLKDRWEQAQEGMGQVVLLIGEPGLGKSRLVYTMKQHVLGQMVEGEVDAPVIEWRCSPHFQNTGFYPAIDFYEKALGIDREEPPEDRFSRVLHRLEHYGLARPETVPLWASLLSLPTPERFPPLLLSPVRQREETFRVMLEWLHVRAARRPILFIVEDLHWVDASTLTFLGQFLAEGLHDSILTVLTFRPEFKTPWSAVAHQTSLALNRLTRRQVRDLVRKKSEAAVSEALVDQIHDRTGGVPLFVEEFTQLVKESGALDTSRDGAPRVDALRSREIPATLQDLVMARLDRMENERELAQLAATLGREFSHEMLAAVAAVDEPTLQAQLAKLVQGEILYAKGRRPQCNYIFKHALLEDALYNALVKGKRQQFHRRIAEVLEAQFPQTVLTQPELLAHHYTEAGIADRAVGYWLKAGLRSREKSAEIEAIGHLTKGLALVGTFAESPERDAQELHFLNPLGTAYIASRGYSVPEVGPIFTRARELCERIGEPLQRFMSTWGLWEFHVAGGDLRRCVELSDEAMVLSERLNDPGMLAEALFMQGITLFFRGDFVGARACHARALAEYDDRERTKFWAGHTGQDAGVAHRCFLALALSHLGYPDQALQVDRQALDLARALGHPFSLAIAHSESGWLYQDCRLGAEAEAAGDEAIRISAEQGFPFWAASGTLFKAGGLLLQRRLDDAAPVLRELVDRYQDLFRGTWGATLASYFSIAGELYTKTGHFDEARRVLDEGLVLAEKRDERFLEAELHRLKGELHLAEANYQAAAESCFCTAIETARRQQSRAWELRATMSLARLWQHQGRRDDARAALATVYSSYTEGFTTPDLIEARALLGAPDCG
jgi:class 3 adenylate cyclase/tetratricopeptide (TPR) repeat protein